MSHHNVGIGAVFSIAVTVAVFAASGAPAEEAPRAVTLDDALRLAAAGNHDIAKATEGVTQAQAKTGEERAAGLPQLTATASAARERDESQRIFAMGLFPLQRDAQAAQLAASYPLFTSGQVGAAVRAAETATAQATDRLGAVRQAVARDVTSAFYDVLLAQELERSARENREQRVRHLDEARRRLSAGSVTGYEVLSAEVAVANAEPEVIETAGAVRVARRRLAYLLGIEGTGLDVVGTLAVGPQAPPDVDDVIATARAHRPELAALRGEELVAAEQARAVRAGVRPHVDARAQWGWQRLAAGGRAVDGAAWRAGVYFSTVLFDGHRMASREAQLKSAERAARVELARERDAIALEAHEAVTAVAEAAEIVKAMTGTVTQAERLLFMAEKGYELGAQSHIEVQDAQLNLQRARGSLARAERNLRVAQTNLRWVEGTLTPPAAP